MATTTPFVIREAFLVTFLNKHAALPMTMTGSLSDAAAVKRVFETASLFTATTLREGYDDETCGALARGTMAAITGRSTFYRVGLGLPVVSGPIDRRLNARLVRLLETYGHADFVTDPDRYRVIVWQPAHHNIKFDRGGADATRCEQSA